MALINNFPPNLDPLTFSFLATLVGSACISDYSASEQNSIGNWLMLVSQFILTSAAQQQLIESRMDNYNLNINSSQAKRGGSAYTGNKSNQNQRDEVDLLLDAVLHLQKELENIKNQLNKK